MNNNHKMGCNESRQKPSEEKAIALAESGLGFSLTEATKFDMVVRKNSKNNMVNSPLLQRIATALKLKTSDYVNHIKISAYYNKLKDESGEIPAKDLLIIGILLSLGLPSTKARLLFQIFDEDATERLTTDQLRDDMFKLMVKHSIGLGFLVANGHNPYSNEIKIAVFTENLRSVETEAINRLIGKLDPRGNNYVQEADFISAFVKMSDGSLTTAAGWRTYLHEIFLSAPPKPAFKNPFLNRAKK